MVLGRVSRGFVPPARAGPSGEQPCSLRPRGTKRLLPLQPRVGRAVLSGRSLGLLPSAGSGCPQGWNPRSPCAVAERAVKTNLLTPEAAGGRPADGWQREKLSVAV